MESGRADEELMIALGGMDTSAMAVELLAMAGKKAVPFLGRTLEDPDLAYVAIDVVTRLGRKARKLRKKLTALSRSEDEVLAERADAALQSLSVRVSGAESEPVRSAPGRRTTVTERLDPCGYADESRRN